MSQRVGQPVALIATRAAIRWLEKGGGWRDPFRETELSAPHVVIGQLVQGGPADQRQRHAEGPVQLVHVHEGSLGPGLIGHRLPIGYAFSEDTLVVEDKEGPQRVFVFSHGENLVLRIPRPDDMRRVHRDEPVRDLAALIFIAL